MPVKTIQKSVNCNLPWEQLRLAHSHLPDATEALRTGQTQITLPLLPLDAIDNLSFSKDNPTISGIDCYPEQVITVWKVQKDPKQPPYWVLDQVKRQETRYSKQRNGFQSGF